MDLLLALLALPGHALVWVALVNRVHSTALPQWLRDGFTWLGFACLLGIPLGFAWWFYRFGLAVIGPGGRLQMPAPAAAYLGVCWIGSVLAVAWWIRRKRTGRVPALLRYDRARLLDRIHPSTGSRTPDDVHHFLAHLPGNEILQLDIVERAFEVPALPEALDRLTIIHLSDLHFTGRVGKGYFQEVVRVCNRLEPELVAITGDLIDNSECIDWIPDTLGRLAGRFGTYYVLGNHDAESDVDRIRRTLSDSGLVGLGGRRIEIRVNDRPILLAGNELPWLPPAADLHGAPPPSADGGPLRIALAHSPDQLPWARANRIDLLLAGHLHGGQIRLPLIGPIFSPSRSGVEYASGVFHDPPTVMHVTRGVSAKLPVRVNCPPEIARLVLRTPAEE